jgi:hypothetical protein
MAQQGLIAARVAPVFNTSIDRGGFSKVTLESMHKARDSRRAPRSAYNRADWEFEPATFTCEEHGVEEVVDDREQAMYADYVDAEAVSRDRAYLTIQQNAEKRMAALIFNATTWSSYTSACTTPLDVHDTSLPFDYFQTAKEAVRLQCGFLANAAIMSYTVFENLKMCAQVIDRIKYWGGDDPKHGGINEATVARALGLEEVIVAGSVKDSALEGQTRSLAEVWDDEYIMVCRVARTNDPSEPCIARTFHYTADGSSYGGTVETYRDETVRGEVVRVRHDVDELVMYTQCGYLLSNADT